MKMTPNSETDSSGIFHTIIGIDSLKGCLSSAEAGQAAAEGVRLALERRGVKGHTDILTLADGGEGMAEAIAMSRPSVIVTVDTVDPLGRPMKGSYWRQPDGEEAWIDMAAASGLGFRIHEELLPVRPGFTAAQAVGDGEDYELLVTFRPGDRERAAQLAAEHFPETPLTVIGEMTAETASALPPGYRHFS